MCLFTKISLDEVIHVIKEIIDLKTSKLAKIYLYSTLFSFQGSYYEKISRVTIGLPLSPIVTNLYIEYFEKKSLASYPLKPACWKRFFDETNIKWTHGIAEFEKLFNHLNSISYEIKFTMELQEKSSIPFLCVLVIKKEDGTLGHQVFRKKTHNEGYVHAESYHNPSQKFGVLNSLIVRALRISYYDHLNV